MAPADPADDKKRGAKDRPPDHGQIFVPGAGPEEKAPKALDHWSRGYEERAHMRIKQELDDDIAAPDIERKSKARTPYRPTYEASDYNSSRRPDGGYTGRDESYRPGDARNQRAPSHGSGERNEQYHRDDGFAAGRGGFNPRDDKRGSGGYDDSRRGGRRYSNNGREQYNDDDDATHGSFSNDRHWKKHDDSAGRGERIESLHGMDVVELLDQLARPRTDVFLELDRARDNHTDIFKSGKAMTVIISGAARRRQHRLAHTCWEYMDKRGLEKNVFHYNAMISVAEKNRDLKMALGFLDEMTSCNIEKNEVTFSSAISACEKCGQWRTALDLLDCMEKEGVGRTAIAYNAAISACEKGLVPQRAYDVFQRMKQEGIQPTVVSYAALISAAEKGGQWKLAIEILQEMNQAGFKDNIVAYSAAISALAKGQQWERALELFRELQAYGGSPSIVTYNATMTALEKGMQWERALALFEEMKMKNMPVTVVSYGSAISACDKGFQYRQCLEFLDEMTEMGIKKNVIIFGAAMSCMEKCCRADISFQLMSRMKAEGIHPNVHIYNSIISACARCGLWEKGYELFKEMDEARVDRDVVTYNAVLDAVTSQIDLGRELFEDGVKKGFYGRVSRLGQQWLELDLHFLSLGGGEIALGWWFEECLVPFLTDVARLEKVASISIVTGYGKSRTRGRRLGNDGMKKRVLAMLSCMDIHELPQNNAGRIIIDRDRLVETVKENGGKIKFDLARYTKWKDDETTANVVPVVTQKVRARFRPVVSGSGKPPFERIETESTSPEYRLENMHRNKHESTTPTMMVTEESQNGRHADSSRPDGGRRYDSGYHKPLQDNKGPNRYQNGGGGGGSNGNNFDSYYGPSRSHDMNDAPQQRNGFRGDNKVRQYDNDAIVKDERSYYGRQRDERGWNKGPAGQNRVDDTGGHFHHQGDRNGSTERGVGGLQRKRNYDQYESQQPSRGYNLGTKVKRR